MCAKSDAWHVRQMDRLEETLGRQAANDFADEHAPDEDEYDGPMEPGGTSVWTPDGPQ